MLGRVSRVSAVASRNVGVCVRRHAHAHAHGHGPAKTLPPRPALPENATFGQRVQHAMWDKRHPDYEGIESYVRYYLPHNHNLAYFVLGTYLTIAVLGIMKSKSGAAAALHAQKAPERPDYRTVKVRSAIPEFGSDEWVDFINEGEESVNKWFASLEEMAAAPAH